MTDWRLQGVAFGTCNCAYGCPCQFEALPTHGDCRGLEALRIDEGHFGTLSLGGLRAVLLYAWPGPIFEGNGTMQAIIDARADAAQREALVKILHGEETEPGASLWQIFHSLASTVHEPLFRPIELEVDIEARRARLVVSSLVESRGEPILSRATGEPHRARIELPEGVGFTVAEMGSGTTRASGAVELDLRHTFACFSTLHHTGKGLVR